MSSGGGAPLRAESAGFGTAGVVSEGFFLYETRRMVALHSSVQYIISMNIHDSYIFIVL
jgi:hypothetical protein